MLTFKNGENHTKIQIRLEIWPSRAAFPHEDKGWSWVGLLHSPHPALEAEATARVSPQSGELEESSGGGEPCAVRGQTWVGLTEEVGTGYW